MTTMSSKIYAIILVAVMLLATVAACTSPAPAPQPTVTAPAGSASPEATPKEEQPDSQITPVLPILPVTMDRDGNYVTLPDKIERIIAMGPSSTEVLSALGYLDNIIASDIFSVNVPNINPDIPFISIMDPDAELIISLMPDIIFVTGMSRAGGNDPFSIFAEAGICLVYIPTSNSIEDIIEDIRFISAVMGEQEKGEEIILSMETQINELRAICETVTDKKTVYFEISAAPFMYSFGSDTFLNEMIELLGAVNIFGKQVSWLSVSDEDILKASPDIIFTSVDYIDDPVGEIKSRPGWNEINAVKNNDVYYIDTDASTRPSHHIITALLEMARAIYPELF